MNEDLDSSEVDAGGTINKSYRVQHSVLNPSQSETHEVRSAPASEACDKELPATLADLTACRERSWGMGAVFTHRFPSWTISDSQTHDERRTL